MIPEPNKQASSSSQPPVRRPQRVPDPFRRGPGGIVGYYDVPRPNRSAKGSSPRPQPALGPDRVILLTVQQVADRLAMSRSWVYAALIYTGVLPSVKCGTSRRIRLTDLERYIDGLRTDEPA